MLNSSFYSTLNMVLVNIIFGSYILHGSGMRFYLLQMLLLTLWWPPMLWRCVASNIDVTVPIKRFWFLPVLGFFLVNLWFLPLFQSVATRSFAHALLALGTTLLGGLVFWAPLFVSRLSWLQQTIYLLGLTLVQTPLVFYLLHTEQALPGFAGIQGSFLTLNPLQEQQVAALFYQAVWWIQLLIIGSKLFWDGAQERAEQDRIQNQVRFENHEWVLLAVRRQG